ncbi:hypothetical protein DYBT9623_05149 [Dyadobacter sp. CECT 9623]|uniref:SHOCT domain-containing protein n=1 Tax=Dyadobacter linearis TaxID=2823330 RepID=A0ABN7REA7_9BACT|nr:SHOCT domain-containing protein [Dyadobacter sp. CECT 9623]CAG5074462.1 hypothetical protein DYBT9623_05149 [Dyadobacter sp. CECT 9623]
MEWIFFGALFIVLIVLAVRHEANKVSERTNIVQSKLASIENFSCSKQINGIKNFYIFAVDDINKKISLVTEINNYIIEYSDIIAVEILQDGNIVQQKSTTRTIGGAVVGGLLAGGVGAVVGGLSGSSTHKSKVSSLYVKILLRNVGVTSLLVKCFDALPMTAKKEVEITDDIYKIGKNHADSIKDLVSIFIDQIDQSSKLINTSNNNLTISISDELMKLSILKDKGVLTESEFLAEKSKILNR